MKFSLAALLAVSATSTVSAFVAPSSSGPYVSRSVLMGGMSGDVGIPCEAECALEKYPNLPESIHPGVVSGQALVDLLQHAKENGAFDVTCERRGDLG